MRVDFIGIRFNIDYDTKPSGSHNCLSQDSLTLVLLVEHGLEFKSKVGVNEGDNECTRRLSCTNSLWLSKSEVTKPCVSAILLHSESVGSC